MSLQNQQKGFALSQLPVIIGMGGINAAGRTSGHHAFRRIVLDALPEHERQQTLLALASLTGRGHRTQDGAWCSAAGENLSASALLAQEAATLRNESLIRRIHPDWFDVNAMPAAKGLKAQAGESPIRFKLRQRQLPDPLPDGWQCRDLGLGDVEVSITGGLEMTVPSPREALVQAAGMLPTGFDPGAWYRSVHHPRGLKMTVFGASDLLGQSGLPWAEISRHVHPDQVAVFASNSIGQMDQEGWGGLMQSLLTGKRATSKQMPLGYAQMVADFMNAYVIGNVGQTGGLMGACATFLYNLQAATQAIRSGQTRVAIVGTADAPITPEVIEGFRTMGALADDASLRALDQLDQLSNDDYRRACRPFAQNCGFTIGESCQFIMLVDDHLAVELGAQILGSVPEVFVNADGFKRSISAPGIGNYLTLSKAAALGRAIVGDDALRHRSFVHAHGTSTPKNRTTESHVLNEVAKAFGIQSWPISAVKAFVGHSQGSAGGDQMMAALGTWATGIRPGISTVETFAEDLYDSNLRLSNQHQVGQPDDFELSLLNAKGFGGNNATALVLSPQVTQRMLAKRHGQQAMSAHTKASEAVLERSQAHENAAMASQFDVTYHFGEQVLEGPELTITQDELTIPGYDKPVSLALKSPFTDMQ